MELFNVLNELEDFIEGSSKVPMTGRILVHQDNLLDYLDRIRTSLPEELRQAKWIIEEREKVLSQTKQEAARLVEDAEKQVEKKADESEITRKAEQIAQEMQQEAEQVAAQIKQGARDYADDILVELEGGLKHIMAKIQANRDELKSMK